MVFSGIPFVFFFLPVFLIIYYLVPFKIKNFILMIFSLIFYAWGEPVYVFLMLFSCLINYILGILVSKLNKKKILLIIAIIINIFLIVLFKYADLLILTINSIFKTNINYLNLALPIGISFFTFQAVSYVIDVYRKEVKPEYNFLNFVTYISMFPQLIAGPIVRYEDVSKEIHERKITFDNFTSGTIRFLEGLFKKVLLANVIGTLWNSISALSNISFMNAWLGVLAYTFQIYFDFSGYSDMAIGMGKMLGFTYLENFNYPYIASSVTDFWRRWHISLSSWFRDYIYIPLGGNRKGTVKTIRNILIVWVLTGLWHGASYNFILWGLYFGVILLIEKYLIKDRIQKWPKFFRHFYTLFIVMISWLIFASGDLTFFINYLKNMFMINTIFIDNNFIFNLYNYLIIIILCFIFSTPIVKKFLNKNNNKIIDIILCFAYILLFIICIAFLVSDSYNPFLYFRF